MIVNIFNSNHNNNNNNKYNNNNNNNNSMRLAILFNVLLNPSFKMTKGFANVATTTASTIKFIY